jgi:hypothetical protein
MRNLLRSTAIQGLTAIVLLTALAIAHVQAADGLRPGEFVWTPEIAPTGPVAIVVSLPEQRAYVYRNGVRIGTSTVSTGKPGYDTPEGIYTIVEKQREHYSNLYDDAPMPFMQRLTWDGLALHAGGLPGYPASHGCIRLPEAFAQALFAATERGTVVVVAATDTFPPSVVSPGLFSPIDAATGTAHPASPSTSSWNPERSPEGPMTLLLSTADRQLVVLRNAVEIGRSDVVVDADIIALGTRAYLLLAGTRSEPSVVLRDRPALRWLELHLPGNRPGDEAWRNAFKARRIVIPDAFARTVYDVLRPGTSVVLTDQPLQSRGSSVDLLTNDQDRR